MGLIILGIMTYLIGLGVFALAQRSATNDLRKELK